MVCTKAAEIANRYNLLLQDGPKAERLWAPMFKWVTNEEDRREALRLAVALTTLDATTWDFRFVQPCNDFNHILLMIAQTPPNEKCGFRLAAAERLLAASDTELNEDPFSDAAYKIRIMFSVALHSIVASQGKCPAVFYTAMQTYRAMFPNETNDVEGYMSVLSKMGQTAMRLEAPLATARLSIKKGQAVSPHRCVELEKVIDQMQSSDSNAERFTPLALPLPPITSPLDGAHMHAATPVLLDAPPPLGAVVPKGPPAPLAVDAILRARRRRLAVAASVDRHAHQQLGLIGYGGARYVAELCG